MLSGHSVLGAASKHTGAVMLVILTLNGLCLTQCSNQNYICSDKFPSRKYFLKYMSLVQFNFLGQLSTECDQNTFPFIVIFQFDFTALIFIEGNFFALI